MTDLTPDQVKDALKKAIKEFLDEQAKQIGWSVIKWFGTGLAIIAAIWILRASGWKIG